MKIKLSFTIIHFNTHGLMWIWAKTERVTRAWTWMVSASGPAGVLSQWVNQVLCVPDLDGDARRIHGDLSRFGQRKALRLARERVLYFLAPKCLHRGYKLWEREPSLGLKGKVRVQRRLLEILICGLCAFAYLRLASGLHLASSAPPCRALACPFIG
jgi:hypothetical protein